MKKAIFFIIISPFVVIGFILGFLEYISDLYFDLCEDFENWYFK